MPTRRQVLTTAGAVAFAGCSEADPGGPLSWPQLHFDAANTGYTPEGSIAAEPTVTSASLTSYPVTSAVTSEGLAFFGLEQGHVARGTTEGTTGWTARPLGERSPTATPAVDDDHVFVTEGTYRGTVESSVLRALERSSGAEAWRVTFDDQFAFAPALSDETLYVRSEAGIHAINANDGTVQWSREAEPFEVEGFDVATDISPAVGNDTVYVPHPSGVTAHDADTGEEHWHAPAQKVRAAPVFAGDVVLISGVRSGVVAVDADTGEAHWSWHDGGMWTSPAVADGTVYATGFNPVALDIETGDVRWEGNVLSDIFASPLVVGDSVIVTSTTETRAFRRDGGVLRKAGETRWRVGPGSMFTPTPVDNQVLVPSLDATLSVID